MSDLISRQDAIEAVRKELVCDGRHEAHDKTCRFIADVLLSALPSAEADMIKHVLPDGSEIEIDEESYEIGYTEGQMADRPTAEPKTGEWEYDPNGMDWNIPAWRCSECGYVAPHIGIADKGIGSNPMNWAGSKYCPECGCKIVGARMKGGDSE